MDETERPEGKQAAPDTHPDWRGEFMRLWNAVAEHHGQRADDRCWLDDDRLYAAAGLPVVDRRVGDKNEMLGNCRLFLSQRCDTGGWKSYRELEEDVTRLQASLLHLLQERAVRS